MNPIATALALLLSLAQPASPDCARLIADMGSDEFDVREAASAAAEKLGARCYLQLTIAGDTHPDVEVRKRCRAAVEQPTQAVLARLGKLPWITVYGSGDPRLPAEHAMYLNAALAEGWDWCDPWPAYVRATELLCLDRIRMHLAFGWSLRSVEAELEQMRAAQAKWLADAAAEVRRLNGLPMQQPNEIK